MLHCYSGDVGAAAAVRAAMERWEKGGGGATASSGRERDHSRLLFCVAFFHCLAAARGRFGARYKT